MTMADQTEHPQDDQPQTFADLIEWMQARIAYLDAQIESFEDQSAFSAVGLVNATLRPLRAEVVMWHDMVEALLQKQHMNAHSYDTTRGTCYTDNTSNEKPAAVVSSAGADS